MAEFSLFARSAVPRRYGAPAKQFWSGAKRSGRMSVSEVRNKEFAGVWHFESAEKNFNEFQKLKEAGLDIKLIVYPDESRFELFTSTGSEYKKINEGRLGKLNSNGHWYFNLPDKETGGTITRNMKIVNKQLLYDVDDGKMGSRWWFARGNTSGSATY